MTDAKTRTATHADRDVVIDIIVAAFVADPAFLHFFGDTYADHAPVFAGHLFDRRVGPGGVTIAGDAAVALWDPPVTSPVADAATGALAVPTDVAARIDGYEAVVDSGLPAAPHWYLGILACHPRARGRGLGRTAMAPGLERAARDGAPALLETTNPDNVGLYERSGWSVEDRRPGPGGLTIWIMSHPGRVPT